MGINCGASVCMSEKNEEVKGTGHIRLDIHQMCMRMCLAARDYYENNRETKDFSLYHTPVLDFIQWAQRGEDIQKTVAVICRDRVYARGIQMALKQVSSLVEIFKSPEAAKTYLKKKEACCMDYYRGDDGAEKSAVANGCSAGYSDFRRSSKGKRRKIHMDSGTVCY